MRLGHGDVRQFVVFALREDLVPGFARFFLQFFFRQFEVIFVHTADGGVHGMFRAAAVHADDFELHVQRPPVELHRRSWMTDEEAKLHRFDPALRVGIVHLRLIPGVFVIARVDDEDVAFFDFGFLGDHFGRDDAVIGHHVRDVHDHAWTVEVSQRNIGDGASARVEGALPHQVRADRVAPVQNLTVGALPAAVCPRDAFEEVHFQRLLTWPGGSENTAILCEVI